MESVTLKTLAETIQAFVTSLGIVLGGVWAFWKFIIQRRHHSKIEFDVNINFLGHQDNNILIEVIALVENKGDVRHNLSDFKFDLAVLKKGDKIVNGDDRINNQVLIPHLIIKNQYWIPPNWIKSFIDPSIKQNFTYFTCIPDDSTFVLLFATFKYPKTKNEFHTAQRVFIVPDR